MAIAVDDDELDDAIEFCRERGVEFYAVNRNYPEEEFDGTVSRKIDADLYIDDRNFGGFPGWSAIWQAMSPESANSGTTARGKASADNSAGWFKRRKK